MIFNITKEQVNKILNFQIEHDCKYRNKHVGAIGGKTTYRFTPTSLGVICVVSCACGNEINVTDYEDW